MFFPVVAQRLLSVSSFHYITCSVPTWLNSCCPDKGMRVSKGPHSSVWNGKQACHPKFTVSRHWSLNSSHSCRRWTVTVLCLSCTCSINASQRLSHLFDTFIYEFMLWVFLYSSGVSRHDWSGCVVHDSPLRNQNHELRLIQVLLGALTALVSEQDCSISPPWGCGAVGLCDFSAVSGSMLMLGVGEPVLSGSSCWSSFWELWGQQKSLFLGLSV